MKIRAITSFKTTRAGGRENVVKVGYRPDIKIGQKSSAVSFTEIQSSTIEPGNKSEVVLDVIGFRTFNNLERGDTFDILELGKNVGAGIIIEVTN